MSDLDSRRRWLGLGGIAMASFLGCIDFTIVNTALPAIQAELGVGVSQTHWVVAAFVMALSACMVTAGRLADIHGRRRVMVAGMLMFAAASAGAGYAGSIGALVAWRVLQGMACAVLYTASATLVAGMFPEHERSRALGLLFGANGIGLAIGPVAGGLVVSGLGWRWVFLLNLPLIALALLLCRGRISESRDRAAGALDWAGTILLAAAAPSLMLAIEARDAVRAASWGIGGAVLLALFVLAQARAANPLIRLTLFRNGRFLAACAATAGLAFFYCAAFLLMPLYLTLARHQDSAAAGWLLLPATLVMALLSPWIGRIADKRGPLALLPAGFAFLAVSAGLQLGFGLSTPWPLVLAAFACMGAGWAAILGPSTAVALAAVDATEQGSAMGASWTLHNVGGALGLAVITAVQERAGGASSVEAFLAGYQASMGVLLGLCLAWALGLAVCRGYWRRARLAQGLSL